MIRCENNIFVLETQNTQYVLGVDKYGYNHHLHWGKKCDINDFGTPQIGDQNSNHPMLDASGRNTRLSVKPCIEAVR